MLRERKTVGWSAWVVLIARPGFQRPRPFTQQAAATPHAARCASICSFRVCIFSSFFTDDIENFSSLCTTSRSLRSGLAAMCNTETWAWCVKASRCTPDGQFSCSPSSLRQYVIPTACLPSTYPLSHPVILARKLTSNDTISPTATRALLVQTSLYCTLWFFGLNSSYS